MLNSYNYDPTQRVSVNTVSGTLTKTCDKSFFKSFKTSQNGFDQLMSDKPYLHIDRKSFDVIVLQVMLMSEDRVIFEVIRKDDFDKMIAENNE